MLLAELFNEGMMKRSDPYTSGDQSTPSSSAPPTKRSTFQARIEGLAAKAKVSTEVARAAWEKAQKDVDPRLGGSVRWAKVTQLLKLNLGI